MSCTPSCAKMSWMFVPRMKSSLLSTVIASPSVKIRRFGSVIAACSLRSSSSVGEHQGVFDGDEPIIHAFRDGLSRHCVMHESPRHVDLAHGAARPGNHLRREHSTDPQLLADSDEQRVHTRMSAAVSSVRLPIPINISAWGCRRRTSAALDRRREPMTDRLENRINQVSNVRRVQPRERRLERLERPAEIRDYDCLRTGPGEIVHDLDVRPVDAQHQLGAGGNRCRDLRGSNVSMLDMPADVSSCTTSASAETPGPVCSQCR